MESKSSHGGHKMAEACGHLKSMHAEGGAKKGAGSKPENTSAPNRGPALTTTPEMRKGR